MRGEGDRHILLLHGYMSDRTSFYYQINFLASAGFKVFAPDFPGFGRSAPLIEAWSVGDYAEWLKKYIRSRGIPRPHVIAHSFGARVAIKAEAGYGFAKSLVIVGGAGLVKERSPAYMRKVRAYRFVKKFAPRFAESHFGSSEYRALSPLMRQSYKKIVNEDLRSCARGVTAVTLLIYGEDDAVTPIEEEGAVFHSLIAGSTLVSMPGGHFCFSEYPRQFNDIALKFIQNNN